jgi:hypothetical protein
VATVLTWEDDAGATVVCEFDVVEIESHEALNEITEYPVEEGSDVADHVRPVAPRLTIEGYVSNKPMWSNPGVDSLASFRQVVLHYPPAPDRLNLSIGQAITGAIGSLTGAATLPKTAQALAFDGFVNRVREIADKLEDARAKARRIRVVTTLREYENMIMEREAEPRAVEDGSGVTFQVDLKQIRTVTSEVVAAPIPAEARGALSVATGSKAGQEATDQDKKREKLRSLLKQGSDSLFGGSSPVGL